MPRWWTRWILRTRATVSARHDRELRDELQLHLQLLTEEYIAQGVPPGVARARAHHEFGNATLIQEHSHDLFSFRIVEDTIQDLRYALREVRRSAGFTGVAVLSLALGIGAVTATFAVIDAFVLRGLPVRDPQRLVALSTNDSVGWRSWPYAAYTTWRDSPDAQFDVAAASDVSAHAAPLGGSDRPGEVRVTLVSPNYFQVIGAEIVIGRDLDGVGSGEAAAVISDAFWERWFGRAPDVLAKTIELHGIGYQVVGVTRKGFSGHTVGHPSDVWIPLAMQSALMPDGPGLLADRWGTGAAWLRIIGRLRTGVNLEEAAASARLIRQRWITQKAAAIGQGHPQVARERMQSVSLIGASTGDAPERVSYARPLWMLSGITALVLLVACANFTNLMLARAEARRREFVIRLALGAGRLRLIRQSATECVVLAVAAGCLGLLFASWVTAASLKQLAVMTMPLELTLDLDARVFAFAGGCVAVVIAFGLWPSTRAARSAVVTAVHQSAGAHSRTRRGNVGGRLMLVAQLALCTVVLTGAVLLLRTVDNLRSQELGFDRNVLLVSVAPIGESEPAATMLVQRIREGLAAVPGIQAIGMSGQALMDSTNYWIDGSQQLTTDRGLAVPGARWTFAEVGPGFFDAVGMTVVAGRAFDDRSEAQGEAPVVINQSLARHLFSDGNPIGRRFSLGSRGRMQTVVGVVNDAKQTSPRDRGMGVVYLPMRGFNHLVLAVRTAGQPADAAPMITHQLHAVAPDLQIAQVRTLAAVLEQAIVQERLMSTVTLFLAALAIVIGCVGLYALMSYDVAQRTRELGIRLALGATSRTVVTMVLRDTALLVVPALAAGLPLGVAASRPLSGQLYGVQVGDPWTLTMVTLLLAAVALLATFKPALAASRIDPIGLLRNE